MGDTAEQGQGQAQALGSKMKKCDPNTFTIHDFLGECKTSDVADSRFDDESGAAASLNAEVTYVLGVPPAKLGNVYSEVAELLGAEQEGWKQRKDSNGRFHMILGGARGSGIPFKRFAQLFKWDYGITPHCNYFRGHVWLTQKVKMLQVVRQEGAELADVVPESFLFFPSSAEDNETEAFKEAAGAGGGASEGKAQDKSEAGGKWWICKASDATRGERTVISDSYDDVMALLDAQDKTSAAWCVQRYVAQPLLLAGGRKADVRFFVLVDKDLQGWVCNETVIKTCKEPFSMANVADNKAAHLSCTAAQGKKPDDDQDDVPAEQFAKVLSGQHNASFETDVVEPAHSIIARVLAAALPKLESADHADFTSFQVFAFDFLLDANLKLWFLEVSAPTQFPKRLVSAIAKDIVNIAIKPVVQDENWEADVECFQPLPLKSNNQQQHK